MKHFKRIKRGFTLVELVVVIAVIAILAAVSVGAYFGITDSANKSKLEAEARLAYDNMQLIAARGDDYCRMSKSGLYLTDIARFTEDMNNMSGLEYTVFSGNKEDKPYYVTRSTIYLIEKESQINNAGVSLDPVIYDAFKYYSTSVPGRYALVSLVGSSIEIFDEDFNIVSNYKTVYFNNSRGWYPSYAHAYNGTFDSKDTSNCLKQWPGLRMHQYIGEIVKIDIPEGYEKLRFNSGYDNDTYFEVSLSAHTEEKPYYNINAAGEYFWDVIPSYESFEDFDVSGKTMYFQDISWSECYIHTWSVDGTQNAAWPGKAATKDENGMYYYTFESDAYKVDITNNLDSNPTTHRNISLRDFADSQPYYDHSSNTWEPIPYIYFVPGTAWEEDNARFAAYFYNSNTNYKWINLTDLDNDGHYECLRPDGYTHVVFARFNPKQSTNSFNKDDGFWNQTINLQLLDDKNCFTVTKWVKDEGTDKGDGVWSYYQPASYVEPYKTPDNITLIGVYGWDNAEDIYFTGDVTKTTFTLSNQEIAKGSSFKIRKDVSWNESWGYDDITNFTEGCFKEEDGNHNNIECLVDGFYNFTFVYNKNEAPEITITKAEGEFSFNIRGSFTENPWADRINLVPTTEDSNILYATIDGSYNDELKIYANDTTGSEAYYWGYESVDSDNIDQIGTDDEHGNILLKADGTYTIYFNKETRKISNDFTPAEEEFTSRKLYLDTNSHWGSLNAYFAAYFFGGTRVDTFVKYEVSTEYSGLYELNIPVGNYTGMKILRVNPEYSTIEWNNTVIWNETTDLTVPQEDSENIAYHIPNDTWNNSDDSVWKTLDKVGTKTLYLEFTGSNTNVWFYAWVWGSAEADAFYKFESLGSNIYKLEVPKDSTSLKINMKSNSNTSMDWNNVTKNTGDLAMHSTNNCIVWNGSSVTWDSYTV